MSYQIEFPNYKARFKISMYPLYTLYNKKFNELQLMIWSTGTDKTLKDVISNTYYVKLITFFYHKKV